MRRKMRINVSIPEWFAFNEKELSSRFEECLKKVEETPGGMKIVIEERVPYRGVFKYRNSVYVEAETYSKVEKLALHAGVGMAEITFRIFTMGQNLGREL